MSAEIVSTILFVAAMATLPYLSVTGSLRRRYLAIDAASYVAAAAAFNSAALFSVDLAPRTWFALIVIAKLAAWWIFAAVHRSSDEMTMTPLKAALLAGAVYLSLIPHQRQFVLDGDEPYYVLLADSIVHDGDLDLRNQYADSVRIAGRKLGAQEGDPVGAHGERYSRHEPFLPLLLAPGVAVAGPVGALATIAIFGALLVWSLMRLLIDEIDRRAAVLLFPFIAFGPPVFYFATRIWPEVPAAFLLSELIRGRRLQRKWWFGIALVGLVLLKLRFVLIALPLVVLVALAGRAHAKRLALIGFAAIAAVALLWFTNPGVIAVRPPDLRGILRGGMMLQGVFGLLLDGGSGLLYQAPLFFFGLFALLRWREAPESLRAAALSSILYLIFLAPRAEWHGGWAPPLRYIAVFTPLFAIAAAQLLRRTTAWLAVACGIPTMLLALHGLAFPPRLFHLANGENAMGEMLSNAFHTDFSRLFPSFVRLNRAAIVASFILVAAAIAFVLLDRYGLRLRVGAIAPALLAIVAISFVALGSSPSRVVEFEDAHVRHEGGDLYPPMWTVARFLYHGGWYMYPGNRATFLFAGGSAKIEYWSYDGAVIRVGSREFTLPPSNEKWATASVDFGARGQTTIECVKGAVNIDRIESN